MKTVDQSCPNPDDFTETLAFFAQQSSPNGVVTGNTRADDCASTNLDEFARATINSFSKP